MIYCIEKSLYKLNAKFSYVKPAIIKMYLFRWTYGRSDDGQDHITN